MIINDLNGETLYLPAEQMAALSVALTINEKRRSSKNYYSTAVVFLLKSLTAFKVSSEANVISAV